MPPKIKLPIEYNIDFVGNSLSDFSSNVSVGKKLKLSDKISVTPQVELGNYQSKGVGVKSKGFGGSIDYDMKSGASLSVGGMSTGSKAKGDGWSSKGYDWNVGITFTYPLGGKKK